MDAREIISTGHCGLRVTLNLADQFAITEVYNALSEELKRMNNMIKDGVDIPIYPVIESVCIFLKKLSVPIKEQATVFEKEPVNQ